MANYSKNNAKKGFTIVELLLAISIAGIALMGLLGATPVMMYQIGYAKQKSTATYLAQEGVELIRNVRDSNLINRLEDPNVHWFDKLNGGGLSYQVDYKRIKDVLLGFDLDAYTGAILNINALGFFEYGSGTPTSFKREIILQKVDAGGTPLLDDDDYVDVKVIVYWSDKYGQHSVTAEDFLYDSF